jgi:hypothetical protein
LNGSSQDEKVSAVNNALRHVIFGVNYFLKAVNFRIGYNFRGQRNCGVVDQRNFSGISAGFGLKLNKLKLFFLLHYISRNTSLWFNN